MHVYQGGMQRSCNKILREQRHERPTGISEESEAGGPCRFHEPPPSMETSSSSVIHGLADHLSMAVL